MPKHYSTYEAKSRLSELLGRVRKGETVTITHRGTPIAEVRPIDEAAVSLDERLAGLERAGIVSPPRGRRTFKPLLKRKGALKRFLESRE